MAPPPNTSGNSQTYTRWKDNPMDSQGVLKLQENTLVGLWKKPESILTTAVPQATSTPCRLLAASSVAKNPSPPPPQRGCILGGGKADWGQGGRCSQEVATVPPLSREGAARPYTLGGVPQRCGVRGRGRKGSGEKRVFLVPLPVDSLKSAGWRVPKSRCTHLRNPSSRQHECRSFWKLL